MPYYDGRDPDSYYRGSHPDFSCVYDGNTPNSFGWYSDFYREEMGWFPSAAHYIMSFFVEPMKEEEHEVPYSIQIYSE